MGMNLVFTDLDGTLLDPETYSWEAARPALDLLRRRSIPWVLVTSKTRAEVEHLRAQLRNEHPFIVENGGAAFIPAGYWPAPVPESKRRDGYEVLEWGTPYAELTAGLRRASEASRCRVRGFSGMAGEAVAALCGMSGEEARLAKQREYDEPFLILDPDRSEALAGAIEEQGLHWTRGGRFWHILGANEKAGAVRALSAVFRTLHGPVRSIGLGDALNDAGFLNEVSEAILIRSPQSAELLARVPHGVVTERPGPAGWNQAILALIGDQAAPSGPD
jgi:mannosyl-3-phosphoglycerate phosphatase